MYTNRRGTMEIFGSQRRVNFTPFNNDRKILLTPYLPSLITDYEAINKAREKDNAENFPSKGILDLEHIICYQDPEEDALAIVQLVKYHTTNALTQEFDLEGCTGVSCAIETADGLFIVIERSPKNRLCAGYLGITAGTIVVPKKDFQNLADLIIFNAFDQISHEIGISQHEIKSLSVVGSTLVDYPVYQGEAIVFCKTSLTSAQIIKLNQKLDSDDIVKVPEKKLHFLTMKEVQLLMQNQETHVATAHALALGIPLFIAWRDEKNPLKKIFRQKTWERFLESIGNLPQYDPHEPWQGFEETLAKVSCKK